MGRTLHRYVSVGRFLIGNIQNSDIVQVNGLPALHEPKWGPFLGAVYQQSILHRLAALAQHVGP